MTASNPDTDSLSHDVDDDSTEFTEFLNSFSSKSDRKNLRYKHLHSFKAITGSKFNNSRGFGWMEKCKCGSSVLVETFYSTDRVMSGKSISFAARQRKTWFSRFGKIVKISGDQSRNGSESE